MKRILLLIFIIFSLTIPVLPDVYPDRFADSEIRTLILNGLEDSYNFELSTAENTFQKIINKYPDDPRGYHYKSSIYLWIYLGNKSEEYYNKFLKYSDLTLEKAENILDKKSEDETALYILGSNYGFRAMAYMKANSHLNAVWAVKNANKYLAETLEINPKKYDAYMGLGLFNYALSLVPGVFKWALKLAGLSGDRSEGVEYLQQAYRHGEFSRTEAAYYLSQIYSETLIDYNISLGYLKQLINKYPGNILFKYSYSVVLIKNRKIQEAEKLLKKIIHDNNEEFAQTVSFSNFLLGDICFRKNDFEKAIDYYEKFLASSVEIDYSGIAYLRIAISHEMLEDRENAAKNYILARNGNTDIPDDQYAKRKGEIYFDRSLTDNEKKIIRAHNLLESGKFKESFDSLSALSESLNNGNLKSELFLYLSDNCYELGKYNESLEYADKAIKGKSGKEKWIKPFAYFYGARALTKNHNDSLAKEYLEKAEDFNDYDYQPKLAAHINSLKLKLKS